MTDEESRQHRRLPPGWLTALITGLLLIAAFSALTFTSEIPPGQRWAAITAFSVLALTLTLQGSPDLYDSLGQTVRQDGRNLLNLLLMLPVLYTTYSLTIGAFSWVGALVALSFVLLPALGFVQSRQQRIPTVFDLFATLYILLSLTFQLVPDLTLPPQHGIVGFFAFGSAPLLLLLLAARGWTGLGFTWFLSWPDLNRALSGGLAVLLVVSVLTGPLGVSQPSFGFPPLLAPVLDEVILAITVYFLTAVPQEILFRGLIQNGIEHYAEAKLWRGPGSFQPGGPFGRLTPRRIALFGATLIFTGAVFFNPPSALAHPLLMAIAGLGYGWVYQQTRKVTASAVAHAVVIWGWTLIFV